MSDNVPSKVVSIKIGGNLFRLAEMLASALGCTVNQVVFRAVRLGVFDLVLDKLRDRRR
jgi:hypothetical protein